MPRPFCFEPNNQYVVSIRFQRHGVSRRHLTAFILIDSVCIFSHLPLSVIYKHMLLNETRNACDAISKPQIIQVLPSAGGWKVFGEKCLYVSISLSLQLVVIPRYEELPGFQGDDGPDERRRQEMEVYMCLDSFTTLPMPALAELCTTLICSISAIMHNGALGESLWWGQRINDSPLCLVKTSHIITHPLLFPSDKSHTVV